MQQLFIFLGLLLTTHFTLASTLDIRVINLPDNHAFDQTIYLAGNINDWDPANQDYLLQLSNDSSYYSISLEGSGELSFKFTKGSWESVEKGENCAEIGNRSASFTTDTLYEATIINWADQCGGNDNFTTSEENVVILENDFYIPQLDRTRRIWAYLPPSYEHSATRFPVIYMHDGQNLFDSQTSFAGEWQVDESLNQLIENGLPPSIVIGIDNGGNHRINELTPWANNDYGGGDGENYMQFVVETLKPHIDSSLRTLPDRNNTGLMGSSLGGLISFYGALKYPDVFSKIGVFSPSFWFSDSCYTFASEQSKLYDMQFYFLAGAKEGSEGQVVQDCKRMIDTLKTTGYSADELKLIVKDDGTHSEWFWRREFPNAYRWFWGFDLVSSMRLSQQLEIFPNPANDSIHLQLNNVNGRYSIHIMNLQGQIMLNQTAQQQSLTIPVNHLKAGIYLVRCTGDDFEVQRKLMIVK